MENKLNLSKMIKLTGELLSIDWFIIGFEEIF